MNPNLFIQKLKSLKKGLNISYKLLVCLSLLTLSYTKILAQAGTLDLTFAPTTGSNGNLSGLAFQPDGKIIIVGGFTTYNGTARNRICRINANGTIDATFTPGTGFNTTTYDPSIQPDGKIIVGGNFATFNGVARSRIARLNTDGTLDATFDVGTGANDFVYTTAVQTDGKILIGGLFTSYNGTLINRIARLNSDGSIDATFNVGSGFNSYPYSISVQNDGKILIGGNFTTYNGTSINRILRLNSDGSLDASFTPGAGASNLVYSTFVQADGKIIIGGNFTSYNGTSRNRIARLNADGTLDATFNPGSGFNNIVYSANSQSDGKVIVSGTFTTFNGTARSRIACLNSDGTLNTNFNPGSGAGNTVFANAIHSDNSIAIGGSFTTYNGTARVRVAKLNRACLEPTSASLTANNFTICNGQSSSLSVSSGTLNDATNWQWYTTSCGGTSAGSGTNIIVSPTTTTIYYARGEGGCTTPLSCATITVTVNSLPVVSITGASTVCSGYSSSLTASGATSYLWSNGSSTAMTAVTPSINTTYSVTGTNSNGCSNTASFNVSPLVCVPNTSLQSVFCSTTLTTLSDRLKCILVSGASRYEWQVTDIATSTVYLRQSSNNLVDMFLSYIPQVTYNKTYSIRVRALSGGGIWGTFGASCTVNTPSAPSTKLQTVHCSTTLTALSNRLKCDPVPSTTKYEWEVTDIATSVVYLKQSANNLVDMYLSYIPQVTYNKSYSIRVRALSGGVWGTFGTACTVTTPASAPRARFALSDYEEPEIGNSINVNAYPNPTSEILNVDFGNVPANASVEIYNMLGELVLTQSLTALNNTINTTQLSNGLYHTKVIGNNKLLYAQKIVKQ
jgi:uncharacterized delta-60 repeat protein